MERAGERQKLVVWWNQGHYEEYKEEDGGMQKVAQGFARGNGVGADRRFALQHDLGRKIISALIVRRVSAVALCFFAVRQIAPSLPGRGSSRTPSAD